MNKIPVEPLIGVLRERHLQRQANDPDYAYRLAMIDHLEKMRRKKTLSLNETVRRKEREETEAWQLTLENSRRLAKNLTPIETLEALESQDDPNSQDDPLLIESAHILLDYAELSAP